jgi:hypothetical protein
MKMRGLGRLLRTTLAPDTLGPASLGALAFVFMAFWACFYAVPTPQFIGPALGPPPSPGNGDKGTYEVSSTGSVGVLALGLAPEAELSFSLGGPRLNLSVAGVGGIALAPMAGGRARAGIGWSFGERIRFSPELSALGGIAYQAGLGILSGGSGSHWTSFGGVEASFPVFFPSAPDPTTDPAGFYLAPRLGLNASFYEDYVFDANAPSGQESSLKLITGYGAAGQLGIGFVWGKTESARFFEISPAAGMGMVSLVPGINLALHATFGGRWEFKGDSSRRGPSGW